MDDKLITLAIHTYDYAVALRDMLVAKGIYVHLDNVDIASPSPACGVRVRIRASELPAALRIVESEPVAAASKVIDALQGTSAEILLPLDLLSDNLNVVSVAFALAASLNLKVRVMHVYTTPYFDGSLSLTDNFTLDVRDAEVRRNIATIASKRMDSFRKKLDDAIISGQLPKVPFTTVTLEGIPEDVILEFCKTTPPELVVMGTRSVAKKTSEMLGSVAAEVVDSCRVPVLTVPEDFKFQSLSALSPATFLCNIDQHDLIAMDLFISLFPQSSDNVTLIPVSDKAGSKLPGRLRALAEYFGEHYPSGKFTYKMPDGKISRETIHEWMSGSPVKIIVVPNKKKNIFARLVNPGIPHKVLFEADVLMLALPV